jgi:hypothetical protein
MQTLQCLYLIFAHSRVSIFDYVPAHCSLSEAEVGLGRYVPAQLLLAAQTVYQSLILHSCAVQDVAFTVRMPRLRWRDQCPTFAIRAESSGSPPFSRDVEVSCEVLHYCCGVALLDVTRRHLCLRSLLTD